MDANIKVNNLKITITTIKKIKAYRTDVICSISFYRFSSCKLSNPTFLDFK